ncbi:hypothetical protein C8Q79DRAFT_1015300 [Trametes meyenii]|nr:hypothetical protein C8Q79DRAFT_1015300 [Trametes meyenii]
MSSRSTRRYAAASTGGRPPKAVQEKEAAEEAKPSAAPRRGRGGARGGRGHGRAAATSARGTRKEVVVSDSEFEDISISDIDAGPAVKGKTKKQTTPEEVSDEESVIIPRLRLMRNEEIVSYGMTSAPARVTPIEPVRKIFSNPAYLAWG